MATEMEIDKDTTVNTLRLTPLLKTSPFIEKGRKLCIICFSGAASKNAKGANLQKIYNIESYKYRAFKWTNYEHVCSKVYEGIDREKKSESMQSAKYYHKNQVQLCRSTRQQFTYQSSQEESKCIICTEVKEDYHRKVIPVQTMTFRSKDDKEHLVEK